MTRLGQMILDDGIRIGALTRSVKWPINEEAKNSKEDGFFD